MGSFPLPSTPENFERALRDQVASGITIPCYPQLVDMIDQFLEPLSEIVDGLDKKSTGYVLSGDIHFPSNAVATEYGRNALAIVEADDSLKSKISGLKACLTGPFTLCSNIIVENEEMVKNKRPLLFSEPRAHLFPDLVSKMASYVARVAGAYKEMGFDIISIDDPFLSQMVGRRKVLFHEQDFVIDTINEAAKNIQGRASLHACGIISPKLRDLLLETSLRYIDHEFKTCPENFDLYDKATLGAHDKVLAYGTIKTNPVPRPGEPVSSYVEPVAELEKELTAAKERFGEGNMIVKPDCGLGGMVAFDRLEPGLGHVISIKKLEAMNEARRRVFG